MEENSLKLHEAASPLVQEWPTYLLQEEVVKESVFSASSSIPSSKSLESEQKFCEGLSSATPKGLEPDLQFTTSTPAQPGQPALAFTDESSSSQQSFEKNWNTMSQDLEHNEKNFKTDQGFYNLGQDHIKKIQEPAKSEANLKIEDDIIPAVVVTQPEEVSSDQEEDTLLSEKLEDIMVCHASHAVSRSDGPELNNSDLQSLKSDTASLISETAISGKSDDQEGPEDDTQSVTASSVMSLFHRLQMDPVEREWLRCAALGNVSVLHLLLQQEPSLISKKDFVTTALHWAAKQGRMEMVDMMARSGADVNQRAHGYTALHLASLHGHDHIIQLLINNYNAKVNIRDYHGKMAAHYWNGNMDIFNKHGSHSVVFHHSAGRWSRGRRAQCYSQLSSLLSRSRSQGNISVEISQLELMPMNRSPSS